MELVRFKGISKSFGANHVLKDVNFSVASGEVVALMGENGAGKSTLMKILSGGITDFEGDFFVGGQAARFFSPQDAEKNGIAIIHQELSFYPDLTVAENLYVGRWPVKKRRVDWSRIYEQAEYWLNQLDCKVDVKKTMRDLTVGHQQLVEIAKAVSRQARVLILDEPTSALSSSEVTRLFQIIRELKSNGYALIYISHRLDEIEQLADRVVILRDGVVVGDKSKWFRSDVVRQMVGRELSNLFPEHKSQKSTGEPILKLKNLEVYSGSQKIVGPINFELRRGEVLGIGGLLGSGRSELLKALVGGYRTKGDITLCGKSVLHLSPPGALKSGIVYLSEDRSRESILRGRSLIENSEISSISQRWGWVKRIKNLKELFRSLNLQYQSARQSIQELSGGNQQKVVLSRLMLTNPRVILLDEPTRGVDVAAKNDIYKILFEWAKEGRSIIVVSSEISELLGVCDRILVLRSGELRGELNHGQWNSESFGRLAFGLA